MKDNEVLAACLVKVKQQFGNESEGVTLFQAFTNNEHKNGIRALQAALQEGLHFNLSIKRTTYNLEDKMKNVLPLLKNNGFKSTDISQVFMTKQLID
ncbi:hypothetical protein MKY37_02000 [Psychrobacillus sp. FSL K6-2836]|uniref:hypothetical protein n=1 Tax=Psychrobacillus sp. FSL K6-2836 TaxID=2921548 RepID=UPI0030F86C21